MAETQKSQSGAPQQVQRPRRADDGPQQTDKTPGGAAPDRQIAQESQQATGQGQGRS